VTEVNFDGRAWTTLGERGNLLAGEGWRYTGNGSVRHFLPNRPHTAAWTAWCGLWMAEEFWRGTGSQEEYERLASLPKCLTCMRKGRL
jgi:hypothetical protein